LKKFFFFLLSLIIGSNAFAVDSIKRYELNGAIYEYKTPSNFEFAKTLPSNGWSYLKNSFSFSDDNLKAWGAIILSSALMIHYDQEITDNVQRLGRKLGIGNNENTVATMKIGGVSLLRRPSDLGSAMYFIGDGWITLGLAGGFLSTGYFTEDPRTRTVGQQLLQGILLTGITTQVIKRATGRQSPIRSDKPGGRWKLLPSFSEYQKDTSKYDAFPSGHLATTMTTFMIISENYPEYKWIKPTGYTLMSLLAFQMVNNSVHWAGDYPLAIGIGYMIGKTIVENGRKKVEDEKSLTDKVTLAPLFSIDGKMGLQASISFK
jgi:hypothetical protein